MEVGDLEPLTSGEGREGASVGHMVGDQARMQAQLMAERNRNFDDDSSTSSDKYEKDVTVLNR